MIMGEASDAFKEAGTNKTYLSGAHEFTPGFIEHEHVLSYFVCVMSASNSPVQKINGIFN